MDALDPQYAPGVGTPVKGGLRTAKRTWRWRSCAIAGGMLSMEVVEVNPVMDEVNRTAELAVELVLSAMGKRIL